MDTHSPVTHIPPNGGQNELCRTNERVDLHPKHSPSVSISIHNLDACADKHIRHKHCISLIDDCVLNEHCMCVCVFSFTNERFGVHAG